MDGHYKLRLFTKAIKTQDDTKNYKFSEIVANPEYHCSTHPKDIFIMGKFVPACKFDCKLYLEPISAGLIRSNTIVMLGDYVSFGINSKGNQYPIPTTDHVSEIDAYRQYIEDDWKVLLYIDSTKSTDLKFFTVDEDSDEAIWTDRLLISYPLKPIPTEFPTTEEYEEAVKEYNSDLQKTMSFNIGFKGDVGGQYETKIHVCEIKTKETSTENLSGMEDIIYVGSITVRGEVIGEDERYRSLFANFGIPDPISYMDVFNKSSEEEKNRLKYDSQIDYDQLNRYSKEMFISYDRIFPFLGTYKALINAVDALGYDDIYFKEWYKEISSVDGQEPTRVAYDVTYGTNKKNNMLNSVPLERRVSLKKMNWLSMIYKLSEELTNEEGDIEYDVLKDNVCFPKIKENYKVYNTLEILQQLIGLRDWLEKYIIGVNCRITEISGEGITFERYKHRIYEKHITGLDLIKECTVTPFLCDYDGNIEMTEQGATIKVGLKELVQNDSRPDVRSEFISSHTDFIIKAMMSTKNSVIMGKSREPINKEDTPPDVPILIQDGEIFFDPKTIITADTDLTAYILEKPIIQIENARLRDPEKSWDESIIYTIKNTNGGSRPYATINEITGESRNQKDYVTLRPSNIILYDNDNNPVSSNVTGSIRYTANNTLGVPLFIIKDYSNYLTPGFIEQDRDMILEILDGKLIFEETYTDKYNETVGKTTYLNFHFDTDSQEQSVEVNYVYEKIAYIKNLDVPHNDHATLTVKNIGDYITYAYVYDKYNSIFCAKCPNIAHVTMPNPEISIVARQNYSNNKSDFFDGNEYGAISKISATDVEEAQGIKNLSKVDAEFRQYSSLCVLKEQYLSNDLTIVESDDYMSIDHVDYPTISYAIDNPTKGDLAHFMNLTDKFVPYGKPIRSAEGEEQSEDKPKTGYTRVWLKRTGNFESNKFSTDRTKTSKQLYPANIVIYDNIHAVPVYQVYTDMIYAYNKTANEWMYYIDVTSDVAGDMFVLYDSTPNTTGENSKGNTKVTFKDDGGALHHVVSSQESAVSDVGSDVDPYDAFTTKRLYTVFAEAVYTITCTNITPSIVNGEPRVTIQIVNGEGGSPIFTEGQCIKLGVKKTLNDSMRNTIESWTTMKVLSVTQDGHDEYITAKGSYKKTGNKQTMYYELPKKPDGSYVDVRGNYSVIEVDDKKFYAPVIVPAETDETTVSRIVNNMSGDERKMYTMLFGSSEDGTDMDVYIAHTNQAFVDYQVEVEEAKETISPSGITTHLFIKDKRLLNYIDNTFSVSSRKFNVVNSYEMWMNDYIYNDGTKDTTYASIFEPDALGQTPENVILYSYTTPITIKVGDDIVIRGSRLSVLGVNQYNYWRVKRYNLDTDTNELLFESWNNTLFMTPVDTGIYSVELFVYDLYGNLTSNEHVGLFKVVE